MQFPSSFRRFRFRLRALLLVVTAIALVLGWEANAVEKRRAATREIESHGGTVFKWQPTSALMPSAGYCGTCAATCANRPELRVSMLRSWLGDKPIESVVVYTAADTALAQRVFPEAEVHCIDEPAPQLDER
jgi:hypothetical protein